MINITQTLILLKFGHENHTKKLRHKRDNNSTLRVNFVLLHVIVMFEFFHLFRCIHVRRVRDTDGGWRNETLVLRAWYLKIATPNFQDFSDTFLIEIWEKNTENPEVYTRLQL